MHEIQRSALVPYSAEEMFDLVNDIESYPQFMRGCTEARIISQSEDEMVGELCLSKAGIKQRFTTRNCLQRPRQIKMNLVEGDFSRFNARWEFEELTDTACRIKFFMAFEFESRLLGFAAEKLFAGTASDLVDSLVKRAREVHS